MKRVVNAYLPDDLLDDVETIGVDETAYKRGHKYLTVVSCLKTGRVVWLGRGKTAETLGQFFDELGPERTAKLKMVAMDMSGSYIKAVKERAPKADIVFDRFHVVKLLLEAVDVIRRAECRMAEGPARAALKNTRFTLLRSPANFKPKDHARIAQIEKANMRLFRTYERRVAFDQLWEIEDEVRGWDFLMDWTKSALLSRLEDQADLFAGTDLRGEVSDLRGVGLAAVAEPGSRLDRVQ